MRVGLVFPPALSIPKPLYYALPQLAGTLREAGHEPQITDLNLLAADAFLDRHYGEHLVGRGFDLAARLEREGDALAGVALARHLNAVAPAALEGEAFKNVLRDPVASLDAKCFMKAFAGVVAALEFFHARDTVISPTRRNFARDVHEDLARDAWTPLRELYESLFIDRILDRGPDLIGFCVAFPAQVMQAIRCATRLRARAPRVPLCFGGPLIEQFAERWLDGGWLLEFVDYVVTGDGEEALVGLVEALEGRGDLADIEALAYRRRDGGVVQPRTPGQPRTRDRASPPDFASADLSLSLTPEPVYSLSLSRGCHWGRCRFCSIGWAESYRRSPDWQIRRDLHALREVYGARYLQIQDASLAPELAQTLASIIRDDALGLVWTAGMRFEAALLDPAYCRLLAGGGCRSLSLGLESTSQRVIDRMDKGFRSSDVPTMLANLRSAGISAELHWFTGFPSESREEALATVRWLADHRDDYGSSAFGGAYRVREKTAIAERPRDFGISLSRDRDGELAYASENGRRDGDFETLMASLADTNNRLLLETGAHVVYLDASRSDTRAIARPMHVPPTLVHSFGEHLNEQAPSSSRSQRETTRSFFEEDFGFREQAEAAWSDVYEEWRALPKAACVPWPEAGSVTGSWDVLIFHIGGRALDSMLRLCPKTAAMLRRIPGLYGAGFSILGPNSIIPEHCGEADFVYRCHLSVVGSEPSAIKVGSEIRGWEEGKTIVFDDTLPHFAWNFGTVPKVLLMMDFIRPGATPETHPTMHAKTRADRLNYARLFPEFAEELLREEVPVRNASRDQRIAR